MALLAVCRSVLPTLLPSYPQLGTVCALVQGARGEGGVPHPWGWTVVAQLAPLWPAEAEAAVAWEAMQDTSVLGWSGRRCLY